MSITGRHARPQKEITAKDMPLAQGTHNLYRIGAYLKHGLTAWNTGGEGIHSPYLFYLVRMLMYDSHRYYVWDDIEAVRRKMLQSKEMLHVSDFGTGRRRQSDRRVSDIARTSLEKAKNAQLLFRWVNFLDSQCKDGMRIVELGTSLGITTAYLATASPKSEVITFEGSHEVAEKARQNWSALKLRNITCIEGDIDTTLADTLYNSARATREGGNGIDFAFIDANHTKEATLRYWRALSLYRHKKSIFVLDDIHHSREMESAWKAIAHEDYVSTTMDLFDMGVVFFDPDYLHRNYRMRF